MPVLADAIIHTGTIISQIENNESFEFTDYLLDCMKIVLEAAEQYNSCSK